jgi:hypothetical protein
MISENSNRETQAKAFSYFAFAGNLGIFAGPFLGMSNRLTNFNYTNTSLGGALESPARKFPGTFGHVQFFSDYPYALPGFLTAFVGLTAAIIATVFIEEVGVPQSL